VPRLFAESSTEPHDERILPEGVEAGQTAARGPFYLADVEREQHLRIVFNPDPDPEEPRTWMFTRLTEQEQIDHGLDQTRKPLEWTQDRLVHVEYVRPDLPDSGVDLGPVMAILDATATAAARWFNQWYATALAGAARSFEWFSSVVAGLGWQTEMVVDPQTGDVARHYFNPLTGQFTIVVTPNVGQELLRDPAIEAIERTVGDFAVRQPSRSDAKRLLDNVSAAALDEILETWRWGLTEKQQAAAFGATRQLMADRGIAFETDAQLIDAVRWMKQIKEGGGSTRLPSGDVLYPGTWIGGRFFVYSEANGFGVIDDARLAHPWEMALTFAGSGRSGPVFHTNDTDTIRWNLTAAEWDTLEVLWAPPDSEDSFLSTFQTVLDMVGFVPIVGDVADLTNAIIYAYNGDWFNCATSLVSVIPTVGDLIGKSSKVVIHAGVVTVIGAKADVVNPILRRWKRVVPSGQIHHPISSKVYRALEQHPILAGRYRPRDPRFTTQAIDQAAHYGYPRWHRELDAEVVNWVRDRVNRGKTPAEFEAWLRWRYLQPDLRARFPSGF
jgi:hypothetical protein